MLPGATWAEAGSRMALTRYRPLSRYWPVCMASGQRATGWISRVCWWPGTGPSLPPSNRALEAAGSSHAQFCIVGHEMALAS